MFNLAKEFKAKKGHIWIKRQSTFRSKPLGHWVVVQLNLSDERVLKLQSLGLSQSQTADAGGKES